MRFGVGLDVGRGILGFVFFSRCFIFNNLLGSFGKFVFVSFSFFRDALGRCEI